jgi:hypothetical protein
MRIVPMHRGGRPGWEDRNGRDDRKSSWGDKAPRGGGRQRGGGRTPRDFQQRSGTDRPPREDWQRQGSDRPSRDEWQSQGSDRPSRDEWQSQGSGRPSRDAGQRQGSDRPTRDERQRRADDSPPPWGSTQSAWDNVDSSGQFQNDTSARGRPSTSGNDGGYGSPRYSAPQADRNGRYSAGEHARGPGQSSVNGARDERYSTPQDEGEGQYSASAADRESDGGEGWQELPLRPKEMLIGEAVYGTNPVLAALLAGRRRMYALYVQEGGRSTSSSRVPHKLFSG